MVDEGIFALLLARVEEAKRRHLGAKERFWEVAGKSRELPRIPTGLPHPDGSELIRQAVRDETLALKAHIDAMMQLNRYLLDGTVPDEVRAQLNKSKSAGSTSPIS
jgi:hypothetical protein